MRPSRHAISNPIFSKGYKTKTPVASSFGILDQYTITYYHESISFAYLFFFSQVRSISVSYHYSAAKVPWEYKHLRYGQIYQNTGEDLEHLPPEEACQQISFCPSHECIPLLFNQNVNKMRA